MTRVFLGGGARQVPRQAAPVEYLYAVVGGESKPPRVERVRVKTRGKSVLTFATREALTGYAMTMSIVAAEMILRPSPEAAVEHWREQIRDSIEQHEHELKRLERLARGPDPKNAWEIEDED